MARVGGASGDAHPWLPLPTWGQQMEQDRVSHVLPPHPELARVWAQDPRGRTDRMQSQVGQFSWRLERHTPAATKETTINLLPRDALGGKNLRCLLTELFAASRCLWYKTAVGLEKTRNRSRLFFRPNNQRFA